MKKEDIISEIEHRLSLYKTINPEEFDFSEFVIGTVPIQITKEPCGTICCLWGWEPRLTGVVKWEYRYGYVSISDTPEDVLGWGKIIDYLYYPYFETCQDEYPHQKGLPRLFGEDPLERVLAAWEKVIALLKEGDSLDHLLNLD